MRRQKERENSFITNINSKEREVVQTQSDNKLCFRQQLRKPITKSPSTVEPSMQDCIRLCLHSTSGCVFQPSPASGPATFASFQFWCPPLSLHCPSALQLPCLVSHKLGQDVARYGQTGLLSVPPCCSVGKS